MSRLIWLTQFHTCISLSFFKELVGFFDWSTIKGFYSFGKTMADKEESEAYEFIEE